MRLPFSALLAALVACIFSLQAQFANALYDPSPAAALSAIEGEWKGTLQYRDWQPPHKRVTLITRLFVAAASPKELALHYVFDDGPNKTVHSYDRMLIDIDTGTLRWSSLKPADTSSAAIISQRTNDGTLEIIAERMEENKSKGKTDVIRYRLRLSKSQFEVLKTAGEKGAESEFRNEYVFRR